ncbi:MAG: thioredoxin-disulfide reductase [Clostridiales Family XIII bacterium]|jgi:thioredoxin reductase (NADPH)|nr:thioredoxin-disulfide reductase [Clostridiales Family XIII bacterium]
MTDKIYDVIIIGGGPAGLSSAIYACRANLSTLIIEKAAFGGNIFQTSEIANYPGGISGETGAEFSARLESHADSFGVEKIQSEVTTMDLFGDVKEIVCGGNSYKGRAVIVATGCVPTQLGVKGENEYIGLGVSYCAICDGPFFSNLDVFVVGGGDSAVEEAMFLAKFARKVTIIHRRSEFRAAKSIVEHAAKVPNIEFKTGTVVRELSGDGLLQKITLEEVETGKETTIEAAAGENFGFFVFVGMKPQTELFTGIIEMDERQYIITDENMHTNISGVFAAGDVRRKRLRQVVTATADGAIAAIEAEVYIQDNL